MMNLEAELEEQHLLAGRYREQVGKYFQNNRTITSSFMQMA